MAQQSECLNQYDDPRMFVLVCIILYSTTLLCTLLLSLPLFIISDRHFCPLCYFLTLLSSSLSPSVSLITLLLSAVVKNSQQGVLGRSRLLLALWLTGEERSTRRVVCVYVDMYMCSGDDQSKIVGWPTVANTQTIIITLPRKGTCRHIFVFLPKWGFSIDFYCFYTEPNMFSVS